MAVAFVHVIFFIYFHLMFIKTQYVTLWYDDMSTTNAWNITNPAEVGIVDGDYWQDYSSYCYSCYYDNPCPNPYITGEFCVFLNMQNGVGASISRLTDISNYELIRLQFDIGAWWITSTANECQVFYAYDSADNKTLLYSQSKYDGSDPWEINNVIIDLPSSPNSNLLWIFLESFDGGEPSSKEQTCYWDDVYLKGANPSVSPTIYPTMNPSVSPTIYPTMNPSVSPTIYPIINPSVSLTIYPTINPSVYPTVGPTVNPSVLCCEAEGEVSDIISTNIEWENTDKTPHHANRMQWIVIMCIVISLLLCVIFIGYVIYRKKGKETIQKFIENIISTSPPEEIAQIPDKNNAKPQQEDRSMKNRGDIKGNMVTSLGAFAVAIKNTTDDHVNHKDVVVDAGRGSERDRDEEDSSKSADKMYDLAEVDPDEELYETVVTPGTATRRVTKQTKSNGNEADRYTVEGA